MTDKLKLAMAASKLLTEARDFIKDRNHWVKGLLFHGIGPDEGGRSLARAPRVCAVGSVMRAAGLGGGHYNSISPEEHSEAFEALRVLADTIQDSGSDYRKGHAFREWESVIVWFNDDSRRSHSEVVAAFDSAVEHQCSVVRELALQADQTELTLDGQKDNAS